MPKLRQQQGADVTFLQPDNRDPLTGAVTEAALIRFVEAVLEISDGQGPAVGLLRVAVDGLPDIAAELGCPTAEAVLLGTADRLHENVRNQDLVGRVGAGFGICMPDLLPAEARRVAERLRRTLAGAPLPTPGGALGITCSIGFALAFESTTRAATLLEAACLALEAAQRSGGDCVMPAAGTEPSRQGSG